MQIRRATAEDAPRVVEIGFAEYMEEMTFMVGLNFNFMTLFVRYVNLSKSPELGHILVAEEDGKIVGFYSCRYVPSMLDDTQKICHESGWFVVPEYRGKGIGRALKKETVKLAVENGCQFMQIGSAVTTETGRSLMEWYQRDGYIPFQMEAFKRITPEDLEK